MCTLVRITYKVLSVTNVAVEKEDATLEFVRIPRYFLGSNIHHNEIQRKYILKWGRGLVTNEFKGRIQPEDPTGDSVPLGL